MYKAVDETLNRDVAVKTLNPDLANTEVMSRFRAEATILARLNHPQIATLFELFRSENDLLMVMEFVRGETLDKLSERLGPLPAERAATLIDSILSALEHAHRAGVVHRDVKPANVMVTDEGSVKIMDFGIARVLGAEQKTVDFRLMGTPAYMSPEQVMGEEVDGRSDLYSVGVLFYRLLTGALPFSADTALAMLQRQIRDTPTPLHVHRAGLPDWCDQVVQRALAKAPADRFQSAEEFRAALMRAAETLPANDLSKAPVATYADTIDLSRHNTSLNRPAAAAVGAAIAPARARFTWAQAAAVVVAIGAVGVGYVVLRERTTEAASETPVAAAPPAVPSATKETSASVWPTADTELVRPAPTVSPGVPPAVVAATSSSTPAPVAAPAATETTPVPRRRLARKASPESSAATSAEAPTETAEVERRLPRPTSEEAAEPSLVFETRAFVGTRKPREQGAQLVLGDGKITIIPQDNPVSRLGSFPYGSVIAIYVSRSRDPLWDSPQGPAPVARAGGTFSKLGIQISRDWISLRTNSEEQFVAMRFDEVLVKRVLLALEERTGRSPRRIELPKDER